MRPVRIGSVIAAGLALALASTALAQAPVAPDAMQRRVEELVRWIATNSDYPPALKRLPQFVFLAPETIRHGFSNSSLGYNVETSSVRAAQVKGTIYLPDTFALGRDDYMLLHELVHYLQDESGRKFECLAMREREAYLLQTTFVKETGVGETPNDMFMLLLRCDIR